jgi:hypothetical protein
MVKRKKNIPLFFSLLILFFPYLIKGQEPGKTPTDSAYYCSFFPMHVGDKWVYKVDFGDGSGWYYYYEIVMDTVDSLNRHWYGWRFKSQDKLFYYAITDSFEVISGYPDVDSTELCYKLNAKPGDKWLIYGNYEWGTVREVDTIYDLGSADRVMKIDEWSWYNYERLLYAASEFFQTGIGLFMIWEEVGPVTYLTGAIIDGVVYGNPSEIEQEKFTLAYDFNLYQNYPNPFNNSTTILFTINSSAKTKLQIIDTLGKEVFMVEHYYEFPGTYDIKFNSSNISSGIYFYKITLFDDNDRVIQISDSKKMVLIK